MCTIKENTDKFNHIKIQISVHQKILQKMKRYATKSEDILQHLQTKTIRIYHFIQQTSKHFKSLTIQELAQI